MGCDMKDLLKAEYTIVTSDGQYIVESYNSRISLHCTQCQVLTFDNLPQAKELLKDIRDSKEFDWIDLHIIKIEKYVIDY